MYPEPLLRGVTSGARNAPATSATVSYPAGLAAGDLMVLFIADAIASGGGITGLSGWTLHPATKADGAGGLDGWVYTKVATSADVAAGSTSYSNSFTTYGGGWVLAAVQAGTYDPVDTFRYSSAIRETSGTGLAVPVVTAPIKGLGLYFLHRRLGTANTANYGVAQTLTQPAGSGENGKHALYVETLTYPNANTRTVLWGNGTGSDYGYFAVTMIVRGLNQPPTVRGLSSGRRPGATATVSVPFPRDLGVGDEMRLLIADGGAISVPPSGWTVLDSSSVIGRLYGKTATGADVMAGSTSYTAAQTTYGGGWILGVAKAGSTAVFTRSYRDSYLNPSVPIVMPSVPVEADGFGLWMLHRRASASAAGVSNHGTPWAGLTGIGGTGSDGNHAAYIEEGLTAGSRTITWSSVNSDDYGYYGVSLAFAPAPSEGGPYLGPYLGSTEIVKAYLGSTEIVKAYLGATQVLGSGGEASPTISDVTGKTIWLRAKDQAGASGSAVTAWDGAAGTFGYAAAGTGTDVTVATGATPNGGKAVHFAKGKYLQGGLVASNSIAASGYEARNLSRNNPDDWWTGTGSTGPWWAQYDITGNAIAATTYALKSSGTYSPTADPVAWELRGSNDGFATHDVLDSQTGQTFPTANYVREYTIASPAAYKSYRLHITANGGATQLHLNEWQLKVDGAAFPFGGTSQAAEVWIVLKKDSTGNACLWSMGSFGTFPQQYPYGSTICEDFGRTDRPNFTITPSTLTSWHIYRVRSSPSGWQAWINGTSIGTTAAQTPSLAYPLLLGAGLRGGFADGFDGYVAEMLVFDRELDATDEAIVSDYLATEHFTMP